MANRVDQASKPRTGRAAPNPTSSPCRRKRKRTTPKGRPKGRPSPSSPSTARPAAYALILGGAEHSPSPANRGGAGRPVGGSASRSPRAGEGRHRRSRTRIPGRRQRLQMKEATFLSEKGREKPALRT